MPYSMPLWTIFTKCPAPTGPQCSQPSSAVPLAVASSRPGVRGMSPRPGARARKIGVSRSTAAAYTVAAALAPKRDEVELAATLRRLSPSATPNIRIVTIADRLLGRDGRMVRAIESIGRGADAYEGEPFRLAIDVG